MNRYKRLRYEAGLTLLAVAEGSGLSRETLMRLESGETSLPAAPTAKALADFYEVSVASLLGHAEAEEAA